MHNIFKIYLLLCLMPFSPVLSTQMEYVLQFFNELSPSKVQFMINLLDDDPLDDDDDTKQDGCISAEKMDRFLKYQYKIAKKYFPKVDKNGDRRIDPSEINKLMDTFMDTAEVRELLETIAENGKQYVGEYGFDPKDGNLTLFKKIVANKIPTTIKMENVDDITGTLLFVYVTELLVKNKDGSISKEQFDSLPEIFEKMKGFVHFADSDGNGDGEADGQEMLAFLDSIKKVKQGADLNEADLEELLQGYQKEMEKRGQKWEL